MARPTFAEARRAVFAVLKARGWEVRPDLKLPYATSPNGRLRLYFKPQAVHFTKHGGGRYGSHQAGNARTIGYDFDLRNENPEVFVAWAKAESERD